MESNDRPPPERDHRAPNQGRARQGPGGRFSVVFRLLNGDEHNPTGIYQEVVPLTHEHLPDEEARTSHEEGWNGLLDKLPVFLGDCE
jgi:uncharacterized protein YndB with AHSA1/START domain